MVIHVIRTRATKDEIEEMLQALGDYIKLAVDIRRGILAGGGVMKSAPEQSVFGNRR